MAVSRCVYHWLLSSFCCWVLTDQKWSFVINFLLANEGTIRAQPSPAQPSPAQPASPATMHKLYSQVSNTKYVTQREGTRCRNLLDYSILPFCLSWRHFIMNRHSNWLPPPKFWCMSTKINDHDTNIIHSSKYQCHNRGRLVLNVAIIETLHCFPAVRRWWLWRGWRYVNSIRVPHINYPPVLTALVKFDRKLIKIWQNMSHRSYLQTMESVMQSGIRRLDPGPGTAQVKHVSRRQKQSNKTVLGLFLFSLILPSTFLLSLPWPPVQPKNFGNPESS